MPCTVPPLSSEQHQLSQQQKSELRTSKQPDLCSCGLVLLSLHLRLLLHRCCRRPAPMVCVYVCVAWEMHSSAFRFSLVDGDAAIIQLRCGPRAAPRGRPSCPPQSRDADDACFFCLRLVLLFFSNHRLFSLCLFLSYTLPLFPSLFSVFQIYCRLCRWLSSVSSEKILAMTYYRELLL